MRDAVTLASRALVAVALLAALVGAERSAEAGMLGFLEWKIDLTKPDEVAKAVRWARDDVIRPHADGLGWDGGPDSSYDLWVETSQPFAVGFSWRPVSSVTVTARIPWHGPKAGAVWGRLFVRHSPDGAHWSSWQELEGAEGNQGASLKTYRGTVSVPRRARERYDGLLQEYRKRDVPWPSDEEAAVRWILQKEPDFFAHELPFVGHLQLLYETSALGGHRLQRIDAEVVFSAGGMHLPPRDPAAYEGRDGPWRFHAEPKP